MNKKILSLAFLALGILGLSSCEENEDFDPTYVVPNYFVGTWQHTQTGNLDDANILSYSDVEKDENCEFDNVVFNADMTFSDTDYTFEDTCTSVTQSGTYQIVDGNIVLTYNDENPADEIPATVFVLDVLTLNDTTLEGSFTDEDTDELVFLKFTKS